VGNGGAPGLCITLPDGLTVSGSAALNVLRAELGAAVPVFGGTAGDQSRCKGTRQLHGTEVLQDSVPFLLVGEGVVFSFGVDTGWRPIGRGGRVSDLTGHVVRAIDGRPATPFYRDFQGTADITHLTEYPLTLGDAVNIGGCPVRPHWIRYVPFEVSEYRVSSQDLTHDNSGLRRRESRAKL